MCCLGRAASLLSAAWSCVRSGGPWKGEAEMQTQSWIINWCHWQPIRRVKCAWQPLCPWSSSPSSPVVPFSLPGTTEDQTFGSLSLLSAHRTQFTTHVVHEIPKCPKTLGLCRSSYSSLVKHTMSRQTNVHLFSQPLRLGYVLLRVSCYWCVWYTLISLILCYTFEPYFSSANPIDKLYVARVISVPSYAVTRGWIVHVGRWSCWRLEELFIIFEWNLIGFQTRELRHPSWYSRQWLYVQFEVDTKKE